MSKFTLSHKHKRDLLAKLDSRSVGFHRFKPRRDWYESRDGKIHVFLTFGRRDKLWYDMDEPDLKELATHDGRVIFLLGSSDRFLSIPASEIFQRLGQHKTGLTKNKRYTFIVRDEHSSVRFRQLPDWELSEYVSSLDFLDKP